MQRGYIWYLIHILTFAFTIFLIELTWKAFMENPTVTTMESINYPVKDLPMPGVSVCNINKISKSRAEKYAQKLSERSGTAVEEIFSNISLLGRLYEYTLPTSPPGSIINFQNFLDKYDSGTDGYFNTYDVLKQISFPCSDLLNNCRWEEEAIRCSDLFVTELTEEGHCCVFNYIFQKNRDNFPEIIRKNNYESVKFGRYGHLSFTIDTNISDFFYTNTLYTEVSAKIMISHPSDFPDTTSGSLTEKFVGVGTETFLRVSTVTTISSSEAKKYSVKKRGCIFRDELSTVFGNYSYSDCIMDCKIRSIKALCNCIPFNYMNIFQNVFHEQCTLADLSCLNRHARKWKTLYPGDYSGDALDNEKQNSIQCRTCYPACANTLYAVSSDIVDILADGVKVRNFSVVHLLMERYVGTLNKQDAFYYWYDIIGLFGGICSLTIGLNFIILFEMIYFVICAIVNNNTRKTRVQSNEPNIEALQEGSEMYFDAKYQYSLQRKTDY